MKKPILFLLSIMIIGTLATSVSAKPATTSPATAAAIKLYKAGNYTQSYIAFTELVKKDPSNALAYYYLGMSSVQLGKKDEAINNYSRAVDLSPNGILGSYAKKGIKCAQSPETCHIVSDEDKPSNETEEDRFIKSNFGSGFSNKARSVYEQQKIENLKREINRNNDVTPVKFKEYKDFSSQGPSNEEIVSALKTLQDAGYTNILGGQNYSEISYLLGTQNNNNNYDVLNLLFGNNSSNNNINPQIIQSLLTTQMTAGF